jgi:hypothetical protein
LYLLRLEFGLSTGYVDSAATSPFLDLSAVPFSAASLDVADRQLLRKDDGKLLFVHLPSSSQLLTSKSVGRLLPDDPESRRSDLKQGVRSGFEAT